MVSPDWGRYNAAMTTSPLPVVAAVPNYNMAESLRALIPQLLKQSYDHIYIIDDASTDDSVAVARSFASERLKVISLKHNRGAGSARNKVLSYLEKPTIIHFVDADVTILTKDTVGVIRQLPLDDNVGFIGGRVATETQKESLWNYGPPSSLFSAVSSPLYMLTRALHLQFLYPLFPQRVRPGTTHRVSGMYWVGEANLVVRSDRMKELGGFTSRYREHDIKPMAYHARKKGYTNWYEPRLAVRHKAIKVRPGGRQLRIWYTDYQMSRHYGGLLRWFFPFLRRWK